MALAALIAFSRLYLFVHFPTDILGGLVLAMGNAWAGEQIIKSGLKGSVQNT